MATFAVTPSSLGNAWSNGKVDLLLEINLNKSRFGYLRSGAMEFSFYDLVSHAARTRPLQAGTLISSGTVTEACFSSSASSIIEMRASNKSKAISGPAFLRANDVVDILMYDEKMRSVFGRLLNHISELHGGSRTFFK